ncbi:cache domain-containing sensor histidine kinase [Lactonifactor longoviformis]|uniref:Two-component system, sensor histidine kinase YesM n=3 Tax=Lactonifactor TaxID=420345 RepID=A0A1M4WA80_9CLOT|nr:sensor histidine kinase [Lactonifactor longoviformis]SHE78119.1 two-component system, sensor histidine kinase YesM [Lactonifactor longoviformis DSM 17459]
MKRIRKAVRGFKTQIVLSFLIVSIIPLIGIGIWTYKNTSGIVNDNVKTFTYANLAQTSKTAAVSIEAYHALIYQIFTDENIVALTDKINAGQDTAVSKNQLRRALRGYASAKPDIQSITILTASGEAVFYDMITAATTKNSWLDEFRLSRREIFQQISGTAGTVMYSTQYATTQGNNDYYLFHMANRIIDYKKVKKRNGVVIVSIDERMLNDICNEDTVRMEDGRYQTMNFIADGEGRLCSFDDPARCGTKLWEKKDTQEEKVRKTKQFLETEGYMSGDHLAVQTYYDEKLDFTFVNASNQAATLGQLRQQRTIICLIVIFSGAALVIIIHFTVAHLTGSVYRVVATMKNVEEGGLAQRIPDEKRMPTEIELIARQFNHMLSKVEESMDKEREAVVRQKNAEIAALEAQINPHFLYNILDTINWMAIDKDEYEISNTINSLAQILRYGLDKSNSMVEIRREVEWLRQYIFLQQTRLKNTFECQINTEPEILGCRIHKLLFQPFVENAILHGFDGVERKHILKISIDGDENRIRIRIQDNGKGMPQETADRFAAGETAEAQERSHIGISNAIGRLKMYYEEEAQAEIKSCPGEGTEITLWIPRLE